MNLNEKKKNLNIIYYSLFIIGLFIAYIGYSSFSDNPNLQNIVINLGTEFLAFTLIYFLINKIFLLENWEVYEKVSQLERKINHTITADEYLDFNQEINADLFIDAQQIYLLGYSLERSLRTYSNILGKRLSAGAEIKIILLDYKIKPLMNIIEKESVHKKAEDWEDSIKLGIKRIKSINLDKASSSGSLKIGYLPYPPSFGISMVNPEKPNGVIYIDIYHHKSSDINATLKLERQDKDWYTFFNKQYHLLWESCRIEEIY
jgi:hypothetical protein